MSRHVSPDRKQHVFKLPGIHLNNRVANPVSDFRKADPPPEHRQTQSLPLPRHNSYLVTSEPVTHDRMTYYHSDTYGGPLKADSPPTRRQKSLPSRRPRGHEERGRQANSAPSRKQRAHSRGAPLPKINTLVARSRGPSGETNHIVTTNFAGFSTKDHEISHQKSTRFATNWAQVRAENHIDICASPDSTPRAGAADENKARDRSPSDRTAAKTRQKQGTSPDRNRTSGDQQRSKPDVCFHATSRDKENVKPENSRQKKEPSPTPASVKSTQPVKKKSREEKGKQTIRFVTPDDERAQKRQGDDASEGADVSESQKAAQERQRSKKKRSQWDSRVTQAPPQQGQPTVTSWRRYEAELSHVPAVTSTEQVYKAYTGRTKEQLRDEEFNAGDGHGKPRPVTRGSSENDDGGDEPGPRSRKEHILTRNEAKMYIHIQNVYGSEAFRQQRKQWFFKKLTDVQLQELKQQAEERRLKQQRKEESKRRQQRQLAYVRRKFRRQQLHRFRTQYVTSRVLEYEKADRDLYGLPDSDDEDGSGYSDAATDSGKNSPKAPSPDSSNKKGPKGDASGFTDTSNKGKATEKKESSKRTGGDQNAKGVTSPGARTQPSKAADAPHKAVGTERDSNTKVTDSQTHAPLNKSSRHEPSGDQFLNNRRDTSNSVRKSKQMDSKAAAIKDTNDVNNRALPPSNAVGTSDPSASKTLNTTPLSRQAKNTVHTKDSNNAQPSTSNNAVKNGQVTKNEESLAKDLLSDREPNSVKEKRGPEQAKASKNIDPSMSSKNNAADAKRKTTTNNEPDKHSTSQKASETPFKPDKSVQHPATSTAKDPAPATKSTTASEKNTPTQAEPVSSSKPESPAEQTAQVKSKPAVADSDGLPSRARNHSVEDGPGKRTTITKDAKGRYFTTTRTFGSQDPPSNAKPSKSSPRDRVVNGHDVPNDGKGTRHASAANRHSDSRGRKHKKTHAQPKSEAEQKKQLERKYGKIFDVNTGPTWNPSAKPPKMEGIDTVYVRVTDDKGRTKLKRREVKDVVKEAKNQLAVPDQDSRGRRVDAKGNKPSTHTGTVRPASADTLDFDDDDDEDTEDVFERVRRKYNLQIDSDDDDISRL